MYAAGAHGYFDAFGMHPYTYPYTPDEPASYNNYCNLGMFYDVMVANGDQDKQVWSTEAGAPTGTYVGSDRRAVSEAQQAMTATRIYQIAASRPVDGPGVLVLLPRLRPRSGRHRAELRHPAQRLDAQAGVRRLRDGDAAGPLRCIASGLRRPAARRTT